MIENDWDSTEMRGIIKLALDEVAVDDETTEIFLRNFFKKFRCRYAKWIWYSSYWIDEIFDCFPISIDKQELLLRIGISEVDAIEKCELLLWIHHQMMLMLLWMLKRNFSQFAINSND